MNDNETPRYRNTCINCVFLGRYRESDLYYCSAVPNILAFHGDGRTSYSSGLLGGWNGETPELEEALIRALSRGFDCRSERYLPVRLGVSGELKMLKIDPSVLIATMRSQPGDDYKIAADWIEERQGTEVVRHMCDLLTSRLLNSLVVLHSRIDPEDLRTLLLSLLAGDSLEWMLDALWEDRENRLYYLAVVDLKGRVKTVLAKALSDIQQAASVCV